MKLLTTIHENDLRALLIGGHAVIAHGVPRATFDLDLMVRKLDRELWRAFMEADGYVLFHETEVFQQWTPPPGEVAVDLMLVDESTWGKMDASARPAAAGMACRLVSAPHLIALKLHAMKFRPGLAGEKDWGDIIGLIRSCHLNPKDAALLALVNKYGSEETQSRYHQHFRTHE